MTAERWLQIHLVGLCLLGAIFVSMGSENGVVPLAVVTAGTVAIIVTDAYRWFRLNRVLANLAAIAAVVVTMQEFFQYRNESQLFAIANLLVYLQLILFFQEKTERIYWQILLLSLLQVVVGAALNLGIGFGMLLLVYTFIAISGLLFFFVHRETNEPEPAKASNRGPSSTWLGQRVAISVPNSRSLQASEFLALPLLRQTISIALGALIFAIGFFFTSPRHPGASWAPFRTLRSPQTGVSRELKLQEMGELLQSNAKVMRVRLLNPQRQPLRRFNPYFAGEVFTRYDPRTARWQISEQFPLDLNRDGNDVPEAPVGAHYEEITMENSSHPSLFSIQPAYRLKGITPRDVRLDGASNLLFRRFEPDAFYPSEFRFAVATTGISNNFQPTIIPARRLETEQDHFLLLDEVSECLHDFDAKRFAGLARVAKEWLDQRGIQSKDPVLLARTLEEHFHTPGIYTYSLNLNVPRNADLDPVEDFVVNHRTGHCQYFASALIMMLRSQGIPARMVVGYCGHEFNESFQYYQVRQRHAHAWVEAYLRKDQVPEFEPTAGTIRSSGAWMRLDPTPSTDERSAELARSWLGTARDWLDYFNVVWSDYVVGLDQKRQEESPLPWGDQQAAKAFDAQAWRERLKMIAAWLGVHFPEGSQGFRFDWRASITAMALTVTLLFIWRGLRWLIHKIGFTRWQIWKRLLVRGSLVPFYARFEKIMATKGFPRSPEQTPREFLHAWSAILPNAGNCERVVDAFYRVRYGQATLTPAEDSELDLYLTELEQWQPNAMRA